MSTVLTLIKTSGTFAWAILFLMSSFFTACGSQSIKGSEAKPPQAQQSQDPGTDATTPDPGIDDDSETGEAEAQASPLNANGSVPNDPDGVYRKFFRDEQGKELLGEKCDVQLANFRNEHPGKNIDALAGYFGETFAPGFCGLHPGVLRGADQGNQCGTKVREAYKTCLLEGESGVTGCRWRYCFFNQFLKIFPYQGVSAPPAETFQFGLGDPNQNRNQVNFSGLKHSWYYDWTLGSFAARQSDPKFVRMSWCGEQQVADDAGNTWDLTQLASRDAALNLARGRVWLIFNEPDDPG